MKKGQEIENCFDCNKPFPKKETELCPDENRRCTGCINEVMDLGEEVL